MSERKVAQGLRVRIRVVLKVKGGQEIERSVVEYVQGAGTMLAGLEDEINGLVAGATRNGVIPAVKAFGNPKSQAEKKISRSEFPKDADMKVGERFAAKGPGGDDIWLEVATVDDSNVGVRLIHPLADKDIEYDVEILSVTDPTPPPLPAEAIATVDD